MQKTVPYNTLRILDLQVRSGTRKRFDPQGRQDFSPRNNAYRPPRGNKMHLVGKGLIRASGHGKTMCPIQPSAQPKCSGLSTLILKIPCRQITPGH